MTGDAYRNSKTRIRICHPRWYLPSPLAQGLNNPINSHPVTVLHWMRNIVDCHVDIKFGYWRLSLQYSDAKWNRWWMPFSYCEHGPLTRYVKLWVVHAPGMPGTFSPPPRISDPDMHHGTCVTHVPWCKPGPLISGLLWSRWWGKRSRHSWRMHNPQFYVSGKRPMKSQEKCCISFHVDFDDLRNGDL